MQLLGGAWFVPASQSNPILLLEDGSQQVPKASQLRREETFVTNVEGHPPCSLETPVFLSLDVSRETDTRGTGTGKTKPDPHAFVNQGFQDNQGLLKGHLRRLWQQSQWWQKPVPEVQIQLSTHVMGPQTLLFTLCLWLFSHPKAKCCEPLSGDSISPS